MTLTSVRRLGAGNFGEVWLEWDDVLEREVAAKYLNASASAQGMDLFDEARTMYAARHDNVVDIFSAGMEHGRQVIRMEYLQNGSVRDVFGRNAMPLGPAVWAIEDACRGVEHLHFRGLLHRDIKPANLLVSEDGRIKVSDFGLACEASQISTASTIAYGIHLPPESLAVGAVPVIVDELGDQYALGLTAYRLINGDDALVVGLAPGAPPADLTPLIVKGKWPSRDHWAPYVPKPLRAAIKKAMQPDPARRHETVQKFRRALEAARPRVSWWQAAGSPLPSWEGASSDGQILWRARVEARPRGAFEFVVERRLPGRSFRKLTADGRQFAERTAADQHASQVLARIAQSGIASG